MIYENISFGKAVPSYIRRSTNSSVVSLYTMGAGHVRFFYNKGEYLRKRTESLYNECISRGFGVKLRQYDISAHQEGGCQDWEPTSYDVDINTERLVSKIRQKPNFYRFRKEKLSMENLFNILTLYKKELEKYG